MDERAQNGISAAQERAATADQHAATADQHANDAMNRANQAVQDAVQVNRDLRELASNIDNYKLQSSVSVLFKFDRSTLTPDAMRHLHQVAVEAKSHGHILITVEGFTDTVGSRQYNQALSRRRAEEVVHYLVTQYDIPVYRIHMVGLGEDKPVAPGHTAAARAQNRRVEVRVFSTGGDTNPANIPSENSASIGTPATVIGSAAPPKQ